MNKPLVSVVLPVYNGGDYIKYSLRSLLQQDVDIEIIVSDDCSSDNTIEIVRSIDSKLITVLENCEKGGQFVNFNRCIGASKGKYIQFFSHDDVASPGFLKSQLRPFEKHSVGLVYSSCNIIDESGDFVDCSDDSGTPLYIDFDTYLYISSRHGSLPPSISSVMVSRRVINEVGQFNESFSVAGDLEFFNRVAEKYLFARNRDLLLDVRIHKNSVTMSSGSAIKYMQEEIAILPYYEKYLDDQSFKEMMAWRVRHRGADHAKFILHAIVSGRFRQCVDAYQALSKVHNVSHCIVFALLQKI